MNSILHFITVKTGWLARPLAGHRWFRLWGVLEHRGRTSGRTYRTPLVIREVPGGFVIPLPFGPGTQWVKNLESAGEASIRWDGRDHHVVEPEQIDLRAAETAFSGFQRLALVRSGIDSFVRVRVAPGT